MAIQTAAETKSASSSVRAGEAPLYPVSIKLQGRRCLVVGGGVVALRKTSELLACGARVRVVAPAWPADFSGLDENPDLTRVTRRFADPDLDGAVLAVAATDDTEVQQEVARRSFARGVLCNVVDVNDLCSFYVPATLRRGSLAVSVATDGAFPLLAVALRDFLAGIVGPQFGPALRSLQAARAAVRRAVPDDAPERTRLLRALLTPEALRMILEDRMDDFENHAASWRRTAGA